MQAETRNVLITGASTGIGEACALALDRAGFRVFAGVRRDADAESLRAQASSRLEPVMLDVTDDASVAAAARHIADTVGEDGLAGVVNNAGISVAGPLEFVPLDELRRQLDVNVTGQIAVTQAVLPMIRAGRGRIVFIGSVGGKLATPFLGPYSASKFALEALADSLRVELRPWRIPVSIVEPGSIATPIWDKGLAAADELERHMPPQAHDMYGAAIDAVREMAKKTAARGIPAARVAGAVMHALTAKRPRTRYPVGTDARIQAALGGLVPDGLRDVVIEQQMGLRGVKPAGRSTKTAETSEV
jgi:NAD(P)-dependent dehydrogenase (short-subunit alcohol dehydrogenase family)